MLRQKQDYINQKSLIMFAQTFDILFLNRLCFEISTLKKKKFNLVIEVVSGPTFEMQTQKMNYCDGLICDLSVRKAIKKNENLCVRKKKKIILTS